jgi:sporulation protein YabP
MDAAKDIKGKQHKLILEGREKLHISGVTDVGSFNDNTVVISTELGDLVVKGNDLHISSLDVNEGNVMIQGFIFSCVYTENAIYKKEKSFLKSIFK